MNVRRQAAIAVMAVGGGLGLAACSGTTHAAVPTTSVAPNAAVATSSGSTSLSDAAGSQPSGVQWNDIFQSISDAHNSLVQSDQDANHNEEGDANP